jgi:hypothetical protein
MSSYLHRFGQALCILGVAGTIWCGIGMFTDETYYDAARAMDKYPGNVLYKTEFKMAEPRHMLLTAGTAGSAPVGIILGSICLGIAAILRRLDA